MKLELQVDEIRELLDLIENEVTFWGEQMPGMGYSKPLNMRDMIDTGTRISLLAQLYVQINDQLLGVNPKINKKRKK